MNTKIKGNKAEAVILSEFVKCEIPVLLPFGDNEKFDLVIFINNNFKSVQIKYANYKNGCVVADSRYRMGANRIKYNTYIDKIDFLAIWCEKLNKSYLLPIIDNKTLITLRITQPKNNSCLTTIKWAKDYEFDSIVNKYKAG